MPDKTDLADITFTHTYLMNIYHEMRTLAEMIYATPST